MRQLPIGPRLTLSFVIIICLTFLGSLIAVSQLLQVRDQTQRLNQINAEAIAILRVNNTILKLKVELHQLANTKDPRFTEKSNELRQTLIKDVEQAIIILEASPAKTQETRYSTQLRQLADIATLPGQIDLMIELAQAGDWLAVQLRLENQVQQVSQITQNLVEEINRIVAAERSLALQNMEQGQQRALTTILMTGLLTLLTAAALGFVVTRSISQPLAQLEQAAKALAHRDFPPPIPLTGEDELTQLSRVFNQTASQLAELYANLESQVQERTQALQQNSQELEHRYLQLETNIALGQRIISILELDSLLNQMVELIKEQYRYDYVGLFLLDKDKSYLIAQAGTGPGGQALCREGFRLKVDETSLMGWVSQHRRVARIDNAPKDNRYVPLTAAPHTHSELALPLVMGGHMLGVLDIQSNKKMAFRIADLPVWQSLANQVAIAIQNASLYQNEQTRRKLAETLYNAGHAISGTLDLSKVLDLILEYLADLVPYDRAAVLLQSGDELEIVAAQGFPTEMQPRQIRVTIRENDVFDRIYQTQHPLAIPDVSQQAGWQNVPGLPLVRAWLGVPLTRFDTVIGMLSLARETANAYQSDEITLAAAFAGQAAIALENARLYDKTTRFTQQLEESVHERTEALQEAYTQLKHLDRTKSDFIKIAAHELRSPLTVLRGYSNLLLEDPDIKENSSLLELVDGIHIGAIRLHEVVNSMLDITKIDNRALKLYPEPLNIPAVIQLVTQELKDILTQRNQTLTIQNMNHLPAIKADPDALQKVFYHLLTNAIKYTPDGGTITIFGHQTNLRSEGIDIVISDTGIGINPEFHELIFTKFYQTGELAMHSTDKTNFKGAGPGLGLAIARGIVDAHQGTLWVESPGYNEKTCPGSQFHLFLPLRQANGNSK